MCMYSVMYFIGQKEAPCHSLAITRDTNNGDREKSSGHPSSLHCVGSSKEVGRTGCLGHAGAAQLQAILATLAAGFSHIKHDMQGQYSRAPMLSLWLLGGTLS
jgi:hypothetical protein